MQEAKCTWSTVSEDKAGLGILGIADELPCLAATLRMACTPRHRPYRGMPDKDRTNKATVIQEDNNVPFATLYGQMSRLAIACQGCWLCFEDVREILVLDLAFLQRRYRSILFLDQPPLTFHVPR
ncbi:MAG: hypothetical protein FRX49_12231 [Trebouxia sp. A1-2]|nr:MAG: hypothetical protein FRX49_12231 [Trebouxia sp. A1-2]